MLNKKLAKNTKSTNMQPNKTLQKLLDKYYRANRARLNAYARRNRVLRGRLVPDGVDSNGWMKWKRTYSLMTPGLETELDANVEKARLYKLKVSAELRAYCKKRKYHICWGNSNQVVRVLSPVEWDVRKNHYSVAVAFTKVIYNLKLTSKWHDFL